MSTGNLAAIAHRGASAYAPEHSLAAYDLALEQGADELELDVRPLADGTLVVLHDRTLRRTCGDPRAAARLLPGDLEDLDAATRPPTLETVLRRYAAATRFLLELKEPSAADGCRLLDLVLALGLRDRVAVQSFDHGALRRLGPVDSGVALAPLYPPLPARAVRADLLRVAPWAAAVTLCQTSVDRPLVRAAHARGLRVQAYTVNDGSTARRLAAMGVDGLITDAPDRVRAALVRPLAA